VPIDYSKRPSRPPAAPTPPPSAPPPAPPPVSLSKITLTKSAPAVSLSKQGGGGRLTVNLNWNQRPAGSGGGGGGFLRKALGGGGGGQIDLDIAALYELSDGSKGVVQALGNSFGAFDRPPYVVLDKDDRSGASTEGENLFVNLAHVRDIRRLLIFTFIYEGAASFDQAAGVVTLTPQAGAPIEVRLDEEAGRARMCAIALLENSGGNDLVVSRQIRYVNGHRDLDAAFGWGLNWAAGRK
jgi:tellurite resistance protein TerA